MCDQDSWDSDSVHAMGMLSVARLLKLIVFVAVIAFGAWGAVQIRNYLRRPRIVNLTERGFEIRGGEAGQRYSWVAVGSRNGRTELEARCGLPADTAVIFHRPFSDRPFIHANPHFPPPALAAGVFVAPTTDRPDVAINDETLFAIRQSGSIGVRTNAAVTCWSLTSDSGAKASRGPVTFKTPFPGLPKVTVWQDGGPTNTALPVGVAGTTTNGFEIIGGPPDATYSWVASYEAVTNELGTNAGYTVASSPRYYSCPLHKRVDSWDYGPFIRQENGTTVWQRCGMCYVRWIEDNCDQS